MIYAEYELLSTRLAATLQAGKNVGAFKDEDVANGVKASLSTSLTGANNDVTITAVDYGEEGNSITVAFTDPGTPSASLSVAAVGTDITANLATDAGTAQVETATVAGAIDGGGAGNATVIVTAVGLTGSPKTYNVAVANSDTAAQVAGKIRTALNADAVLTALYAVGGASATVTLTEVTPNGNDGTLNISVDNGTCTGLTPALTSVNTTPGVAPAITTTAAQLKTAWDLVASVVALATIANKTGNDGTGVVTALTQTALVGGADQSTTQVQADIRANTVYADNEMLQTRLAKAVGVSNVIGEITTTTLTADDSVAEVIARFNDVPTKVDLISL